MGPSGPGLEKICNFEDFCWGKVHILLDLCCQHLGLYVNLGGFCGPFGPRVGKFAILRISVGIALCMAKVKVSN